MTFCTGAQAVQTDPGFDHVQASSDSGLRGGVVGIEIAAGNASVTAVADGVGPS
jgi:hypothetical protein